MRLIITSYLKTFIKHWVSTFGILLFIIMLGAVVLGMMSTPLQLSATIKNVHKQSQDYNYRVLSDQSYSDDFSYNYFALNGYKYTTNDNPQHKALLKTWNDATPIEPDNLRSFLNDIKNSSELAQTTFFNRSFYLLMDSIMTKSLNDIGKEGEDWVDIINGDDANDIAATDSVKGTMRWFITNSLTSTEYTASDSMSINLENLKDSTNKPRITMAELIDIVVDDLKKALASDDWITQPNIDTSQKITARAARVVNAFLQVNNATSYQVEDNQEVDFDQVKTALNAREKTNWINLTSIAYLNPDFNRELWLSNHHDLNTFLFNQIISNPLNKDAVSEDGKPLFEMDSSYEFGLNLTLPGSWTPAFSTDVRSINESSPFNKPLLQKGEKPKEDFYKSKEVALSPSFLKENDLKIGDQLKLPESSFKDNVPNSDNVATIVSHELRVKIVGTALKYDELTPGKNYTAFLQPFKNYTYSYLPPIYLSDYVHTQYTYIRNNEQTNSPLTAIRIKNIIDNDSFSQALILSQADGEGIFTDPTDVVYPYSSWSTISSLNMINIQVIIYTILGAVCLILAFVFINFVIKKEINETRRQLGIFKSFGYKTSELSMVFAIKTVITLASGMLIGWILSFPIQVYMAGNFTDSVMFDFQRIYFAWGLILVILILIPGFFMLISYLITLNYLHYSALILINNQSTNRQRRQHMGLISKSLAKHRRGFSYRLAQSFLKGSKGKYAVVQILFAFSALIYTLMFGAESIMYQAIEQGFAILKDDTNHEYQWKNKATLTMDAEGKYVLRSPETYEQDKVQYLDEENYQSPNEAMTLDETYKNQFSDARYRFRIFTDALSNSLKPSEYNLTNPEEGIKTWALMPLDEAINLINGKISGGSLSPSNPYFLYRLLTFKGLNPQLENANKLTDVIKNMAANNQGYQGNYEDFLKLVGLKGDAWISISDIIGGMSDAYARDKDNRTPLIKALGYTLFGMSAQTDNSALYNNLLLTDLSRVFSMFFANQYIVSELNNALADQEKTDENIENALIKIYKEVNNPKSPFYNYSPTNQKFWNVQNNPLIGSIQHENNVVDQTTTQANEGPNITDLLGSLGSSFTGMLTAGMLASGKNDLLNEPVINFNNMFYNKAKEYLALILRVIPDDIDVGASSLDLIDFKNYAFGNPNNLINFDGVSENQYKKLSEKPLGKNTFNTIVPYAVAQDRHLEVGQQMTFYSDTSSREKITLNIVGINKAMTLPITATWLFMVDYNLFIDEMFSDDLKTAIGFEENIIKDEANQALAKNYLFNDVMSQKPMLNGTFNIMNIGDSLNSFAFDGDQLVLNLDPQSQVFGNLLKTLAGSILPGNIAEKLNGLNIDGSLNLLTNPMMYDKSNRAIIAAPYNILREGFDSFSMTMSNTMLIFLILQSVLLTIILCVVMNIIVDEAAIIILTLRSIGYSQREINWIIMFPYVIGVIISFILAYVLSAVIWKVFLMIAGNSWGIYITYPFDWKGLVIPALVLGVVMFIGWLASNFQVNRRPLTQITSLA